MPTVHPLLHSLTLEELDDAHRVVETILGFLPDVGIVAIDLESKIVQMGGELHASQGMTANAELGCPISRAMHPSAWAVVEGRWAAALRGSNASLDWTSLDGAAAYTLSFSPIRTADGDVIGAAMVAQDITESWRAHRQLERRARQQTALAELGTLALQGMVTEELLQQASRTVEATLGADLAAVLPYTAAGGLRVSAVSSETDVASPGATASTEPGLIMDHMRDVTGPLVIGDLRFSAVRAPVLEAEGMRSLIVAPIGAPESRYGLLGACSRASDCFTEEDAAFLQSMANTLAGAIGHERAADVVLRSAAQLNEAQRLSDIGSWEISVDTGAGMVSDHLREMLCLDEESVHMKDLYARVHDEDSERVRAYTGAEPIEFRIVAPDGAIRLLRSESTAVAVGENGERTIRGTLQDVTEARRAEAALRRSEERFRQGFDNAPIGMTLIDPGTGRYQRVNAAYCRFVGRSAEELLAMTYHQLVHPDEADVPDRQQFGEGNRNALVAEGRYLRPDGTVVWGSISAARVLGPDGDVDVLFSQIIDITERRAHEEAMRHEAEQVAWLKEINAALEEDRFELHAQPIIDLSTGAILQHELLLRMRSPTGELIAPGEFLPAAEQYGLIREIDRWVIARGAEIAATGVAVEINLSGTSMSDLHAVEDIDLAIERTGADPSLLIFEITETAAIENVDNARRLAQSLRDRGCRFALDDFGTGFAGISSLKSLPLDYLKIDREFVKDLVVNETDRHVLVATIDLARAFGLKTIAEGVEDQATLDLLRELGADHAQGFFFGKPAPVRLPGMR